MTNHSDPAPVKAADPNKKQRRLTNALFSEEQLSKPGKRARVLSERPSVCAQRPPHGGW